MWGHYANAGMGIAIEINEKLKTEKFKEVIYGTEQKSETIIDIMKRKSNQWSYEQEVRFISETEEKHLKKSISKIYFGTPYRELCNYDEIKNTHTKLKKYLSLSDLLKKYCDEKSIPYEDYSFTNLETK